MEHEYSNLDFSYYHMPALTMCRAIHVEENEC